MDLLNLKNPIYTNTTKPRGYTVAVNIFGLHDKKAQARQLISVLPELTAEQAKTLYVVFDIMASQNAGQWYMIVQAAARECWGREYNSLLDYKISGIASDEFAPVYKEILRGLSHDASKYRTLSTAFFEVWRVLSRKAV